MKYPCGLVKDIMPLFVDEVCSEESRAAVKEHLNECEKCREYLLKLQSEEIVVEKNNKKEEELIKADSLKKIKKKLNSRLKRIVISSACAVVALISVYHILFTMPVKELSLEDVSVSVEVYPIDELEKIEDGSDAVNTIRADENDNSKEYTVKIPELGSRIKVSENIEKITNPGCKDTWRLYDRETNMAIADVITLNNETIDETKPYTIFDQVHIWKSKKVENFYAKKLQVPVYIDGQLVYECPSLKEIREYCIEQVNTLWSEIKRFYNPHKYYVDLSKDLWFLKNSMLERVRSGK